MYCILRNLYNKMTIVLSISNTNLSCKEVTQQLLNWKVPASVTENYSVVCSQNKCHMEQGCRVVLENLDKELYQKMKDNFNLSCAHVQKYSNFEGCAEDYFSDTNCPGN